MGWGWSEDVLQHGTSIGSKLTQQSNMDSREKRGNPAYLKGMRSSTRLYLMGNDSYSPAAMAPLGLFLPALTFI